MTITVAGMPCAVESLHTFRGGDGVYRDARAPGSYGERRLVSEIWSGDGLLGLASSERSSRIPNRWIGGPAGYPPMRKIPKNPNALFDRTPCCNPRRRPKPEGE